MADHGRNDPSEGADYVVPEDLAAPITVSRREVDFLISEGVLVPKRGGPPGSTHWSPQVKCWVTALPSNKR